MLASTQTPLQLADGTLIYPDGRKVSPNAAPKFIEIPTNTEAQDLVVKARKKLADLPDVPKTMNVVSVILSYTLFGLEIEEIALATGLTVGQIENIKLSPAYTEMHSKILESVLEVEANTVRDIFAQKAVKSAKVIVEGLYSQDRAEQKSAAREILDRGGFRPADIVEHRHSMSGGLTIEIVKRSDKEVLTLDLNIDKEF